MEALEDGDTEEGGLELTVAETSEVDGAFAVRQDGIDYALRGWVCVVGDPTRLRVRFFAEEEDGRRTLGRAIARLPHEAAVEDRCESGAAHRFELTLTGAEALALQGVTITAVAQTQTLVGHRTVLGARTVDYAPTAYLSELIAAQVVTVEDDLTTIPASVTALMDAEDRRGRIHVYGVLACADHDTRLQTTGIGVMGPRAALRCGSEDDRFTHTLRVELRGWRPLGMEHMGHSAGRQAIAVMGGAELSLHGRAAPGWTRLAAAPAVDDAVRLVDRVPWNEEDEVFVASSQFRFDLHSRGRITRVEDGGATLAVDWATQSAHRGDVTRYGDQTFDARAEVGLLTRNIQIVGTEIVRNGLDQRGGHVMIAGRSRAYVEGVELRHLGQLGLLGRYPFHWHHAGDASGQYLRDSAIVDSFQRCVTIHATHNVEVTDNVCFETYGHAFFLELGTETGNTLSGNLAAAVRKPALGRELLFSDNQSDSPGIFLGPAAFWISNPDNVVRDNVAAGFEGSGFWYALAHEVTGPDGVTVYPSQTALGELSGNVAHSGPIGLTIDGGPNGDAVPGGAGDREVTMTFYRPPTPPVFEGNTFYQLSRVAIYARGTRMIFRGNVTGDNRLSYRLGQNQEVEDALVVGQSAHLIGQAAGGLRGYALYDGPSQVDGMRFVAFDSPYATALEAIGAANRPIHRLSGLSFEGTVTQRLGTDGTERARQAAFLDEDGGASGLPGATVFAEDHPFHHAPGGCFSLEWGGVACPHRYGSLHLSADQPAVVRAAANGATVGGDAPEQAVTYVTLPVGSEDVYQLRPNPETWPASSEIAFRFVQPGQASPVIRLDLPADTVQLVGAARVDGFNQLRAATETAFFVRDGRVFFRIVADREDDRGDRHTPSGEAYAGAVTVEYAR